MCISAHYLCNTHYVHARVSRTSRFLRGKAVFLHPPPVGILFLSRPRDLHNSNSPPTYPVARHLWAHRYAPRSRNSYPLARFPRAAVCRWVNTASDICKVNTIIMHLPRWRITVVLASSRFFASSPPSLCATCIVQLAHAYGKGFSSVHHFMYNNMTM